jgi:hypothetical protein
MSIDLPPLTSRIIDKQAFAVQITTEEWIIDGDIHVMINHRPSDVLNDENKFIPVTNATLTPREGGESEKISFLALSKGTILYLRERA